MPCDEEPEFLSLADAAEMFGVLATTLERWARDGSIPSEVTSDGRRIFRRVDVVKRVVRLRPAPPNDE